MRLSIEINDELIQKIQKIYPDKPTQELVEEALSLYIAFHSKNQLSEFWGSIEIEHEI